MKKLVVLYKDNVATDLDTIKKEFEGLGFNVIILPPNVAMGVIDDMSWNGTLNEEGLE